MEHVNHPKVRIHIDHERYESPNPTTGTALYTLGGVAEHHDLFREVGGDREDELIPRNHHEVTLKEDDHFYSQKVFSIIVNAEKKEVVKNHLTFEEVVQLAFNPVPSGPNVLITVDYAKGPPENPKGSMKKGQTVRIKNGMIFDVTAPDRS